MLEGSPFITGLLEVVGLAVLSWVIEKLAFRSSRRAPSSPLFILAQVRPLPPPPPQRIYRLSPPVLCIFIFQTHTRW